MSRVDHRSSGGHVLSDTSWLDLHLKACRDEYAEMVEWVGLRPGWRVVDVGCGAGSLLPLLERAAPGGAIHGCDLSIDTLRAARDRGLRSAAVASVTALPYADGAFDAAWCANVVEFLSPAELAMALGELARVVRPGGLVAVKDVDVQLLRVHPGDPHLTTRLSMATIADPTTSRQALGSLIGRQLRRRLESTGLIEVVQRTWLIERWAPLSADVRRYYRQWFTYLADLAARLRLPDPDREQWDRLASGELLDDPELYLSEGQVVAAGRVPATVASRGVAASPGP